MTEKFRLIDRLEMHASTGRTCATLKLWKKQISSLEKRGFTVKKLNLTNRFSEYVCEISWLKPTVPCSPATDMLKVSIEALQKNI